MEKSEVVDNRDTRRHPRKRVLFGGKIAYQDGAVSFDCTIIDVSATGARLRVSRGRAIPLRFHLVDIRNRTAYEAVRVWYKPPLAGVRFEATHPLAGAVPERLQYLRKLWVESAAR